MKNTTCQNKPGVLEALILSAIVAPARKVLRALQTEDSNVGRLRRFMLAVIALPFLCIVIGMLNVWLRIRGHITVVTTTHNGARFRCHLPDVIQMYLHLFGTWEPDISAYLKRALVPGDCMIDIGANIGYHAMTAHRAVGPGGNIVAIEASPRMLAFLDDTLQRNDAKANVRVVAAAATASAGTIAVYEGPAHDWGLTTTVTTAKGVGVEAQVRADTLDSLLTAKEIETARVVKIDVEGGEPAVVAGMAGFLAKCRDDAEILLEVSPQWWNSENSQRTPAEFLQPFADAGFNAYALPNSHWPWRYLWHKDVAAPKRVRGKLTERVRRLDLVLSRKDVDEL